MAAACLSRTRDLETHLAPLATTLVEINLPNEASVDCVAFFLQVFKRLTSRRFFAWKQAAVGVGWLKKGAETGAGERRKGHSSQQVNRYSV